MIHYLYTPAGLSSLGKREHNALRLISGVCAGGVGSAVGMGFEMEFGPAAETAAVHRGPPRSVGVGYYINPSAETGQLI